MMASGDTYCLKHGWEPCDCAGAKPRIRKPSAASMPKALTVPPSPLFSFDDEATPPRRPSSIARIQLWGLIATAIDPVRGERNEVIKRDEDPSRAIMRAIARMVEDG